MEIKLTNNVCNSIQYYFRSEPSPIRGWSTMKGRLSNKRLIWIHPVHRVRVGGGGELKDLWRGIIESHPTLWGTRYKDYCAVKRSERREVHAGGSGPSDGSRYAKKFIFFAMRLEAHTAQHLIEVDLCNVELIICRGIRLTAGFSLKLDFRKLEQARAKTYTRYMQAFVAYCRSMLARLSLL